MTTQNRIRSKFLARIPAALAVPVLLLAGAVAAQAQYQVTSLGSAVVENFNGMQVPTGTITAINFNAALGDTTQGQRNAAWVLSSTAGRGNDNGSGSPGGGWTAYANVNTSANKALGQLGNGSYPGGNATATFVNATGSTVTSFVLSYTGEQWRANSGPGSITVQYSVNGGTFTNLATSTFNLNIVNATNILNTTTSAGALNGDASGNRTTGLGATVNSLSLSNGQNVQFRFLYTVGSSSKAVAIDDISVTFDGAAPPPAVGNFWVGSDETLGGSGTWVASGGTAWRTTNTDGAGGAFDAAQPANFGGATAGTVTVSGTVAPQEGINFNTTGYTVTGGTINLAGSASANNTISTGSAVTATINSELTGTTGMTKSGSGTLNLGGVNTYSGNTIVSAGVLAVSNASALGASGSANRTIVSSGAGLEVSGGVNIASEEFTISGTGISSGGAIRSTSGDNTLGGDILLGAAARVNTDAGSLTLGGNVTNGGFLLTVGGSGSTTMSGNISGGGGLTKDGSGTLVLSGASDYTGITTVSNGVLNVRNSSALGTVAGSTTVASGAALELQGGIAVGTEGLSIVGTGVSNGGAVRNISGTNTFAGAVTMSGASRINSDSGTLGFTGTVSMGSSILTVGGAGATYFSGALSSGNLTVESGSVTLNGTAANTYTGTTSLTGGDLTLAKTAGTNAVAGNLSVSGGTVRLGASDQIANSSAVTVSGGSIDLGGYSEGVGAVVISGGASIGNGTFSGANYTLSGSTISANLTGSGAMSVTAGTNTLSGNSSAYSGAVTVAGGTLNVAADNALGSGDVSLRGGATLDATGASVIANNITINATSVSASQNFNSMGTSASASVPTGWVASTAGNGNSGNYTTLTRSTTTEAASSGSPTAGGFYNWGNGSDTTDRSVGFMTSGSYANPNSIMYRYENTSGATISSLDLAFDYERYRINTSAANVTFFTSTDGNAWTARTAGDSGAFSTGSSAYNFTSGTVVSANFTLSGLSVANGSSLYFRWLFDTTGTSSQGIGLDNFRMSFSDSTPATLGSSLEDSAVLYTGAIAVNSAANLLAGSGTTVSFNGSISGNGSITKTGSGVVALNAANTLAGNATVSAGTLRLGAANALGNITSVTVNSTATLEVAVSGSVRDAAAVTLAGGTILRGDGVSEAFGALTLSANSTIDFGSGATGNLTFASLTPAGFVLSLTNFTIGNALRFETGSFSASNFNFNGFDYRTSAFGDGFAITAIPEPTVILPILAFIGLFLWGERKRLPNQIRKRLRKFGLART